MKDRITTAPVVLESWFDQEDGVWEAKAYLADSPDRSGWGRAEHCVDAQAMALRQLANDLSPAAT